jgi:hypothetical protein
LEKCPKCGAPLGKPVDGAEQKRTVTDIPLPEHIIYEIVKASAVNADETGFRI